MVKIDKIVQTTHGAHPTRWAHCSNLITFRCNYVCFISIMIKIDKIQQTTHGAHSITRRANCACGWYRVIFCLTINIYLNLAKYLHWKY